MNEKVIDGLTIGVRVRLQEIFESAPKWLVIRGWFS
jgi:hypothetical protein